MSPGLIVMILVTQQFKNKNKSSIRKPKARLCSRGNTKFGCDNIKPIIYHKPSYGIRAENYIMQKINWITFDVLVKKVCIGKIRFNTKLQAGQELWAII